MLPEKVGGQLDLFDNWDFYAGALIAWSCVAVVLVGAAFRMSAKQEKRPKLLRPAVLFLAPYFVFLGVGFTRPYFSITDVPSIQPYFFYVWTSSLYAVGLYVLGGLAVFAGYVMYPAASRRYSSLWRILVRPSFESLKVYVGSRKLPYFLTSVLLLWAIGLAANLAIFAQVGGIPLFNIRIRESEDPKLTFLAEFQPLIALLAPYVTTLNSTLPARFRRILRFRNYALIVGVSLALLALLGSRNLPAKLGLAILVFWLLSPTQRAAPRASAESRRWRMSHANRARVILLLGILLFLLIGVGGAFTKVEIYRMPIQSLPGVVFGTPVSDSVGNMYSFEVIANYSGPYGRFHGNLLYTTFLSYIPGRDELYANYIVGEIIGYKESTLQSISSTFSGPAFLDFGIVGLILNSMVFGFLLRYGWEGARNSPRNLGALALFLATMILDIHLGTYNIWTFFSIAILIGCVEYSRIP